MYSPLLLDHLQSPRHKGDLVSPDVRGEARYRPCGDGLRLTMSLLDDRIVEIGFSAFGCPFAQAAGSAAAALLSGMDVEMARNLSAYDLDQALGGVPPSKRHAILMVLECLYQALGPRDILTSEKPMSEPIQEHRDEPETQPSPAVATARRRAHFARPGRPRLPDAAPAPALETIHRRGEE